jgi:O-antigen/teichoic acid export membrane protein
MKESRTVVGELRRLLFQSSHYLTALVVNLALGFVSFPIFTRAFSVADYGVIDLVQKILLLLAAFAKLGQQNSALRFYDSSSFSQDPAKARQYYSTLYLGVAALSIVVILGFAAASPLLPASLIPPSLAGILGFTCALIALRALQSIIWAFLRIEERTVLLNVANVVLRGASIVAVIVLLPILGASVRTYYAGTVGVELLLIGGLTIPLIVRGKLRLGSFDLSLFRTALLFGAPLVIQELAGVILDSGDRFLVQIYLGANPLGFFSVASGLAGYVNTLMMMPLSLAILPIYMRLWNSEGAEKTIHFLSISLDFFLMAAAGVFALVLVCAHDTVVLLASAKYRGADALIPTLVAGLLLYSTHAFTTAGLVIHKKTGTLAMGLVYSACLKMGLNVVLLPRMGLQGAAVATVIAYAFCAVYLAWASFRLLPLRIHFRSALAYAGAAAVASLAGSAVNLSHPLTDFLARASVALGVYIVTLWLIDSRVRSTAERVWQELRRKTEIKGAVAA